MNNFIKQHRYHLLVLFVFLIIVGISGYQSFRISNYQLPISNEFPITNFQNTTTISEKNITNAPIVRNVQIKQIEQAERLNNFNTTTPLITNYQLLITGTSTVYEAMKNSELNFKTKSFSGLGEFVEEINGLKNDTPAGKYWIYYVNGESAKLGVSQQIVYPNDLIEWRYEDID